MLKKFSIGLLTVSTLILPLSTFAQRPNTQAKIKQSANVRQEDRRDNGRHLGQLKPRQDLQVSMNGTLTAINGSVLTIKLKNGTSYSVDATNARLIRRYGAPMQMSDFQVNDLLFVKGTLNGTTINAKLVQDLSLQARNGQFAGTVESISGSGFVLKSLHRGSQTIHVNASTTFLKNGKPAAFSDLTVGATVKVDGVWNRTNSNVTAIKVHIVVKVAEVRVNGTVTAMSSSTMTMTGTDEKIYTVDVSKAKVSGNGYFGTDLSKIHVGDRVQVWGRSETGSTNIKASLVIDFSL